MFDLHHPTIRQFKAHLMGIDGGSKGEKTSNEMAVDVSKFLRYACGSSATDPQWDKLADHDQSLGFLDKLKRNGVGPDSQLGKLDALTLAAKFVQVVLLQKDPDPTLQNKLSSVLTDMLCWKATLRKEKRKKRTGRLEALSAEKLDLDEVNRHIDCDKVWEDYMDVCRRAKLGEKVSDKELNMSTIAIATTIL